MVPCYWCYWCQHNLKRPAFLRGRGHLLLDKASNVPHDGDGVDGGSAGGRPGYVPVPAAGASLAGRTLFAPPRLQSSLPPPRETGTTSAGKKKLVELGAQGIVDPPVCPERRRGSVLPSVQRGAGVQSSRLSRAQGFSPMAAVWRFSLRLCRNVGMIFILRCTFLFGLPKVRFWQVASGTQRRRR